MIKIVKFVKKKLWKKFLINKKLKFLNNNYAILKYYEGIFFRINDIFIFLKDNMNMVKNMELD